MRTTITARHCEVSDDLRARARELIERLARFATRPHGAQVIFSADHRAASAEVRLHTVRGHVYVATADGDDHRSALDRAAARIRRQLDKVPARRRRTRPARLAGEPR